MLTGSANFTDTDCHRNLNHLFAFRDSDLLEDFGQEFREAWAGEFGRGRLGKPPKTHDLSGVPVKVLFAPDHGPEAEVVKQMLKCPKGGRIDFAMFTFMGSSAIDDAMIVLAGADRTIRGVLDRGQGASKYAASRWLQEAGVEVLDPEQTNRGFANFTTSWPSSISRRSSAAPSTTPSRPPSTTTRRCWCSEAPTPSPKE